MKPSAVLLIDLENFYHSRRDFFRDNNTPLGDQPEPSDDLAAIVKYAEKLSGLPLSVRRAYANFNTLSITPREVMHRGIEPVQVFCLAESTNKNAADMKLAMDAVALATSGAPFEHFVLVTGDSDFIPVILELKSRGFGVSAIAVPGSTSPLIRRFVDGYKRFDDIGPPKAVKPTNRLVGAKPAAPAVASAPPPLTVVVTAVEPAPASNTNPPPVPAPAAPLPSMPPGGVEHLPSIAAALKQLLTRSGPVRFNQVHRHLSAELGYTFDPKAFGVGSTGTFLRQHAGTLGVGVRGTNNEQEVYLPPTASPGSNGTNGKHPPAPKLTSPPEPHTAAHYRELLATRRAGSTENIVTVVPWSALVAVCDAAVTALAPPTGQPTPGVRLVPALKAAGAPSEAGLIASALSGALSKTPDGAAYTVAPEDTGATVRARLLKYIVWALDTRLHDTKTAGPMRLDAVVEMFEPGADRAQVEAEIAAVAEPAPEQGAVAEPVAAPKRYSARLEAIHTAHGYQELLAAGGEGPDDPSLNPPPWSWFAGVCEGAFTLLAPANGGECPAGEFQKRLNALEQEAGDEQFRSHVSRAIPVLKLSNAVIEEGGQVSLHPHVTEAEDVRGAVLWELLRTLARRLREREIPGAVRADAFLAAIGAGPLTNDLLPQIEQAAEEIERDLASAGPEAEPELIEAEAAADPVRTELELEIVTQFTEEPVPLVEPELTADTDTGSEPTTALAADAPPEGAANEPPAVATVATEWTGSDGFDGAIPEYAPQEPAVQESVVAYDPLSGPADVPPEPSSSGVLDVHAITRDAIESAAEPVGPGMQNEWDTAPPALQPCLDAQPEVQPEPEPVQTSAQSEATEPLTATQADESRAGVQSVASESSAPVSQPHVPEEPQPFPEPVPAPVEQTAEVVFHGINLTELLADPVAVEQPNAPDDIPFADLAEDETPNGPAPAEPSAPGANHALSPADAFGAVDMINAPHPPNVSEPPLPPMHPGSA